MKLAIDVDMNYALEGGDPALLAITAAQTKGQTVLSSVLQIENATLRCIDGEDNVGQRVWAHAEGGRLNLRYRAQVDISRANVALPTLAATPLCALSGEVLTYLRPSRLCPSDWLHAFAEERFGHLDGGEKIAAILDWTATSLVYVPGSSFATTTAFDTFITREGVCRDYAHLVCGLARAGNIPARYAAGYGANVDPPDFHAVAEVWLDGAWHLVDATGMSTAGDLAIIGSGRDAGDIPFMQTEKWATFIHQRIYVSAEHPA
jgi:transglutaminase-like putative cysteine protease